MIVTPNTKVYLLSNIPLNNQNEHQMTFSSVSSQTNYFSGKLHKSYTDFTYQREEEALKIPDNVDNLYNCNYVMYQNSSFSSKWFYAFITKKEYINPNTTRIFIETDVFQTWQFEMNLKQCFIEREHVPRWIASGIPTINTVPEGLEHGTEYDVVHEHSYSGGSGVYLMACTTDFENATSQSPIPDTPPMPKPQRVQGLATGLDYLILSSSTQLKYLFNFFSTLPQYLECIQSITYLPRECYEGATISTFTIGSVIYERVESFDQALIKEVLTADKYTGFPSVTESKLLMYPYSYLEVTAYNGNTLEMQIEHFLDVISFQSWGYMNADTRLAFVAKDYNGETSLNNALIITDYPQLPTASSGYQQYLARNKTSNAVSLGLGALSVVGGAVARSPEAMISGASSIATNLAKQQDAKRTPNSMLTQKGGSGFNVANGIQGFTIKKKMIKSEYRQILSEYWKAYGYKVNRIKTPNIKSRSHFNYIKTIGANITGNIPNEDLTKIKNMFDRGVTFWHTSDVGNYSLSNGEV